MGSVYFSGQIMASEIYLVLVVVFWKMAGLDEKVQAWTLYHLKNNEKNWGSLALVRNTFKIWIPVIWEKDSNYG